MVTDPLIIIKKLGITLRVFNCIKIYSVIAISYIFYHVILQKVVLELITSPYLMGTLWIFSMAIIVERYLMVKRKMIVINDSQINLIETQVTEKSVSPN
jgi:hypothetical protein